MNSTLHWDSYWQGSISLNSFGEGEAAQGYTGELLTFWNSCFMQLPKNATVVDVGTGNGAIAVAARKYSDNQQLNYTIHGTDAAKISPLQVFAANPQLTAILKTIEFYPECRTEKLPFADATADLVTSQFAFEYAERETALAECIRILKPAGYFTAIMHHADSEIARDSAAGLAVLTAFLKDTSFFQHARTLLTSMAEQARRPDKPALAQQTQRANQTLLSLSQQIKLQVPAESLHWYNDVMARVAKLILHFSAAGLVQLDAEQQGLSLFWQRLSDQKQASLSAAGAEQFRQSLTAAGYAFELTEIKIENQLFGWLLQIQK
ncbi:class I SAM-dependent methyltransferase [Arsukibacterium ikkense]|uniref:class I SAM-dependent methyltransferase n=1 Tax=Arsukibacterium ikkense TaxID=336831 RepID=UPI00069B0E49|nr:class I SAM-dependent methyltransferase [Arsukibacterium ikkense]